jgi:alcohol dehydrogenase YqhD (iron-dependent ADH family)
MKTIVKDQKDYDARASLCLAAMFANSGYHSIGLSGV